MKTAYEKWDDSFYDKLSFEGHVKLEFHDEWREKKVNFCNSFFPVAVNSLMWVVVRDLI